MARAWNITTSYDWCRRRRRRRRRPKLQDDNDKDDDDGGLVYVKNAKAASSTGAGVTLLVAHRVGALLFGRSDGTGDEPCRTRHRQHSAADLNLAAALLDKNSSGKENSSMFLWSMVRHPSRRALSSYNFFHVSRFQRPNTPAALKRYVLKQRNHQLRSLSLSTTTTTTSTTNNNNNISNPSLRIREILQHYNFVGVAERLAESLVVLQLLLRLEKEDDRPLLVLSAKRAGGYDDGKSRFGCTYIQPTTQCCSDDDMMMLELFGGNNNGSSDFVRDNYDFALYRAINVSLDLTMDALGRAQVEERVRRYKWWQTKVEEQCRGEAVFPCSSDGRAQFEASAKSCYENDWGCGHECVDRILKEEY